MKELSSHNWAMMFKRKYSIAMLGSLSLALLLSPEASAVDSTNGVATPTGSISFNLNSDGEQYRVTVEGQFTNLPDGKPFSLCLIGKDPSSPKLDTKECYGFVHRTDKPFKSVFNLPEKYLLEAMAGLFSPLTFESTQTSNVVFASLINETYVCQAQKTCKTSKPAPSTKDTASSSTITSRYADGYKLSNQPPAKLKALGFYGYFSSNKKMTKSNATRFCQYFIRQSSLRSDYFDGLNPKEMATFLQGCTAAALKIPYGK